MTILGALSVSVGLLGGLWTYVTLSGWVPLQVWASFLAWGCFYHAGGKTAGLKNSIFCNAYGAIVAFLVLTIWLKAGLKGQASLILVSALVFAGIVALIMAAKSPLLSVIPANVYGFATMVGVTLLLTDGLKASAKLTDFSLGLGNPLIGTIVAMALGAVLGFISEKWGGAMAKS